MTRYSDLCAYQVAEMVANGDLDIVGYIEEVYANIERYEVSLGAYITIRDKDDVIRDALEIEKKVKRGERVGKLAGVVVAVKDNICTAGIRTTCASRMLENYVPPFDAHVIERLKQEDAIIIGKTNMDEFAMGSTTETSAFKITRNPWDLSRVPGGSSGGSAVAIASREATIALGSDTGGSIRAPAAFTGTFGLKPTYGLVSRYGLIPYANSLEQIGPMARCTRDLALLLEVIGGHDPRDSTSLRINSLTYDLSDSFEFVRKARIGVVKELFEGCSDDVRKVVEDAIYKLEQEGARIEEVSLPSLRYALPAYYVIAMAEASSNLARYDGVRYGLPCDIHKNWNEAYMEVRGAGFGLEVKRRIILGSFVLSAGYYEEYYIKALKVRRLVLNDFLAAFKNFDILVSPTMPVLPPRIGEAITDPLTLYAMDLDTVVANLAGIPALSLPAGLSHSLPVGLQLMAPPLEEERLFKASLVLEELLGTKNLKPKVIG